MAAALLAPGRTTLHRVPDILDVDIMAELLRRLGCTVEHDAPAGTVVVDVPEKLDHRADYDLVRRMRASINVLGPLVVRSGAAEVALPGGDAIGSRGRSTSTSPGWPAWAPSWTASTASSSPARRTACVGAPIYLDFPSVGATENLLMAATLAAGTTIIDNAAREPEIVDLCRMLDKMGALDRRDRHVHPRDPGRRPAEPGGARDRAGPDARWDVRVRRCDDPRLGDDPRCPGRPPRAAPGKADADRGDRRAAARRVPGLDGPAAAGGRRGDAALSRASRPTCSPWCWRSTPSPRARRWSPRTSSRPGSCSSTSSSGSGPTYGPMGTTPSSAARSSSRRAPVRATDIRAGAGLVVAALCAEGETTVERCVPRRPRLSGVRRGDA